MITCQQFELTNLITKCSSKNVFVFMKFKGHCTFVVIVLLIVGIQKKT